MFVPILLGSEKDLDHASKITKVLDDFEVGYKVMVASAHKVPDQVLEIIKKYDSKKSPFVTLPAPVARTPCPDLWPLTR